MPRGRMEGGTQLPRWQRLAKSRQETGHRSPSPSLQSSGRETESSGVEDIRQGLIWGLLGKWIREQGATSGPGENLLLELRFKDKLVPVEGESVVS